VIQKRTRRGRDGKAYHVFRVRWRDSAGEHRSKTLPRGTTRQQAEDFERRVVTLKRIGRLDDLDRGRQLLADFAEEWWEVYAAQHLQRSTLKTYATIWNRHVLPRLGGHELREITPHVIVTLTLDLEAAGVGGPTVRKALAVLQGMLQRAVEWERIDSNPVRAVRKPAINRDRVVRALAPVEVEAIRDELRARDATIVSCLAYSGPRPGELLRFPLCWQDLGERTLLYRQPKTKKLPRPVRLVGPLAQDLAEWRLVQARPLSGPVFPAHDGEAWSIDEWRNWARRIFRPAAERAGVDIGRPYDLRHTWASLLIQEGRLTLVEIAEQMGHSTQTLLSTYAHVIAELSGEQRPVEDLIREARSPTGAAHMRPTSSQGQG